MKPALQPPIDPSLLPATFHVVFGRTTHSGHGSRASKNQQNQNNPSSTSLHPNQNSQQPSHLNQRAQNEQHTLRLPTRSHVRLEHLSKIWEEIIRENELENHNFRPFDLMNVNRTAQKEQKPDENADERAFASVVSRNESNPRGEEDEFIVQQNEEKKKTKGKIQRMERETVERSEIGIQTLPETRDIGVLTRKIKEKTTISVDDDILNDAKVNASKDVEALLRQSQARRSVLLLKKQSITRIPSTKTSQQTQTQPEKRNISLQTEISNESVHVQTLTQPEQIQQSAFVPTTTTTPPQIQLPQIPIVIELRVSNNQQQPQIIQQPQQPVQIQPERKDVSTKARKIKEPEQIQQPKQEERGVQTNEIQTTDSSQTVCDVPIQTSPLLQQPQQQIELPTEEELFGNEEEEEKKEKEAKLEENESNRSVGETSGTEITSISRRFSPSLKSETTSSTINTTMSSMLSEGEVVTADLNGIVSDGEIFVFNPKQKQQKSPGQTQSPGESQSEGEY